jgi:hypothetical protein
MFRRDAGVLGPHRRSVPGSLHLVQPTQDQRTLRKFTLSLPEMSISGQCKTWQPRRRHEISMVLPVEREIRTRYGIQMEQASDSSPTPAHFETSESRMESLPSQSNAGLLPLENPTTPGSGAIFDVKTLEPWPIIFTAADNNSVRFNAVDGCTHSREKSYFLSDSTTRHRVVDIDDEGEQLCKGRILHASLQWRGL